MTVFSHLSPTFFSSGVFSLPLLLSGSLFFFLLPSLPLSGEGEGEDIKGEERAEASFYGVALDEAKQ